MKFVEVFSVGAIEQTMPSTWLAQGRAYENIKIGEELVCLGNAKQRIVFVVKEIITYRKSVAELNSGLTGELILAGDQAVFGSGTVSMLYREE